MRALPRPGPRRASVRASQPRVFDQAGQTARAGKAAGDDQMISNTQGVDYVGFRSHAQINPRSIQGAARVRPVRYAC